MLILLACLLCGLSATGCVTERQCEEIRRNAEYWKPSVDDTYNDADLIGRGLYLGNVCAAHNETWLRTHRVDLVISVAREWREPCVTAVETVAYDLDDSNSENEAKTRVIFDAAVAPITQRLSRNQTVLVHCNMGISRSASVVLAYLQQRHPHRSYQSLLRVIRLNRRVATPNNLFGRILTAVEL